MRLDLIDKGFALATEFLSYLRQKSSEDHQVKMSAIKVKAADSRMIEAVGDLAGKLDRATADIVAQVSEKIEKEQWEDLKGQIQSLQLALELDDLSAVKHSVLQITKQIDYAKNRLNEQKMGWLGPWLVAESVRLVALNHVAPAKGGAVIIAREAKKFRLSLLDFSKDHLLSLPNVPWEEIAEFVEGKNENMLSLISPGSGDDAATKLIGSSRAKGRSRESAEVIEEPAPKKKSMLNPAVAWPFPTGSGRP